MHPTLNEDIDLSKIGAKSNLSIWWLCYQGHEWKTTPQRMATGSCPVCSNRQIRPGFNDLATIYPDLIPYWNKDKNGNLTPQQVGKNFNKKVWWVCDKGHEYETLIANRRLRTSCQVCSGKKVLSGFNDLATTNPLMIKYWHPIKNLPLKPETITRGYGHKLWWTCSEDHEYQTLASNRIATGDKCPYCSGKKLVSGVNDFAAKNPHLISQWSAKNKLKPTEVSYQSNQKVWWVCEEGHAWEAIISNRHKGTGCPVCAGHRLDVGVNDLASLYPEIASEWHPTRNEQIEPKDVTAGVSRSFWWKCEQGHEYSAHIRDRVLGDGCNKCYRLGLPSGTTSLAEAYPLIAAQWDYVKNKDFDPSVVAQTSSKRVWWICDVNPEHSWVAAVSSRTSNGTGCPICWKSSSTSKAEKEIGDFLEKLGEIPVNGDREVLDGQEIDFYLPDHQIGIEYNGLYWHSEAAGKDHKYHQNKLAKAKSKNITLIQVWEDDWLDRQAIIKRHLAYRLRKLDELKKVEPDMEAKFFEKFPARKGAIVVSSYKELKYFFEENHIQGSVKGTYYLALKDSNGQVRAALILAKTGEKGTYIISRYAACGIVQGGFSRLLKAAITSYRPQRLVTFADLTISSGALYERTGFKAESTIKPDYSYSKRKNRYHKFGFRLKRFKSDPNLLFKEGLTEKELAELNGYTRVWDAGKIRYVLDL